MGREIIKDIEDREGDVADQALTLPIRYGVRPALWVTTIVFVILIALTIMPFILDIFGFVYLDTPKKRKTC